MKKVLFVFGTRPEAIKLAPLVKVFKNNSSFDTKVCVTGQHRQMLDQVLSFFEISPDYDLNLMKDNQTLFSITAEGIQGMEKIMKDFVPDAVFVQGDTTTAFLGALAGFYQRSSVIHIEAGLRSGNKQSPFPEEMNRILTGNLANYHFAPTIKAKENLINEAITENIYVVGNTVIDALQLGIDIIRKSGEKKYNDFFKFVDFSKKIILVTGHRRESFGAPFKNMCEAILKIATEFEKDVEIVYPVHLNPNVQKTVNNILKSQPNIHLIDPLDYPFLIWLMSKSHLVLTDSGGIQEEAPSLGKPVLVMRNVTERTEGIDANTAKLVGTDKDVIINEVTTLLTEENEYQKMAQAKNPYGDGTTCKQIIDILINE